MAAQQTFAFFQASDGSEQEAFKASKKIKKAARTPVGLSVPQPKSQPKPAVVEVSTETSTDSSDDRESVLQRLRHQVGCVRTANQSAGNEISTGSADINAMLPTGGLKANTLTEWISSSSGSGASTLSMIAAANHLRSKNGPLVIVDLPGNFYPPAAISLGVPSEKMILVRPTQHADMVWALDQALRCDAVAGVWANLPGHLDDRDARRFQLAAEIGNTPGFLVRNEAVRGKPSFAEVRFCVTTNPQFNCRYDTSSATRFLQVTLERCRGGAIGQSVQVQIDDQARIQPVSIPAAAEILSPTSTPNLPKNPCHETAAVHLAAQLASPATARSTDRKQRRA